MRSLRDLRGDVLREFGRRLARFGFDPRPKGQSFLRKIEGGRVSVHLGFISHENDFDVTIDVGIRFDAVEELVHRSEALLTKREKAETSTLGAELGNIECGRPFRVTVTGNSDTEGAVGQLIAKFESIGLPYLEHYSQMESAYEVLARDDRGGWIHSPINAERAKSACALLAVMGRYSDLEALGRQKSCFLESIRDPGAAMFSRFLAELIQSTPSPNTPSPRQLRNAP